MFIISLLLLLRRLNIVDYVLGHVWMQFYDHYIEWGLMVPIKKLTEIRKRNGIKATSTVNILAAEADLYMAEIDNKIIVKIGPKQDLGNLLPPNVQVATNGQDYAVWERK